MESGGRLRRVPSPQIVGQQIRRSARFHIRRFAPSSRFVSPGPAPSYVSGTNATQRLLDKTWRPHCADASTLALNHLHMGTHRDAVIEINDVLIEQADAAA